VNEPENQQLLTPELLSHVSVDDLKSAAARERLHYWARLVDPSYLWPSHLRKLCDALEAVERGDCKRLMVSMPPRHGKSETCSVKFPAWFLGRNPDKEFIVAGHTASLVEGFSRRARGDFEVYAPTVFGYSLSQSSGSVQQWGVEGHRGQLHAAGLGGSLTGKGGNVLLLDDPVKDAEAAQSEVQREAAWAWYCTTFRTRLAPGGAIIVVQTRWHEDDVAGRLIKEEKNGGEKWDKLVMPAVDDTGTFSVFDGPVLWPERFSRDELLATKRAVGSRVWEALYQQRPSTPDGHVFLRKWWRWYLKRPERFDQVVQSWDMAFKDTKSSDYVVGQVWGRRGADKYLLDQVRGRMTFSETCAEVQALSKKWPQARKKLVEDKANGTAVLDSLKHIVPGLVAVNPEGGKEARAYAIQPDCEAGNVYLPDRALCPWVDDFVEECAQFPFGGHDDQVDAMTQALIKMQGPTSYYAGLPAGKISPRRA
jgi:predicted phage terminase large subunit-like protein